MNNENSGEVNMLGSKMTQKREYFVSEPSCEANASIIWLHGLGADGSDFAGIVDQLGLPANHAVRFIFPSAPFINITINNGMLMRGWYDIFDLNMLDNEDGEGIESSREKILEYILHEKDLGIDQNRIILAGFSQGGAMALHTAFNLKFNIGGVIALSCYLPLMKHCVISKDLNQIPIFMAHGMFDPIVPYNLGLAACKFLQDRECNIEWHSYPIQHTINMEEISAIGLFIRRYLNYA